MSQDLEPRGNIEQRVSELLEKLARLTLPGQQDARTIDEFTYQQLIVGFKDLGAEVTTTDTIEMMAALRRSKKTYFDSEASPIRQRNFHLFTELASLVVPIVYGEPKSVSRGDVTITLQAVDRSKIYEWQRNTVERLRGEHPESVFVRGLRQALIDHLPDR